MSFLYQNNISFIKSISNPKNLIQKRFEIRPKRVKYKKQQKGFFTVNSGGSLAGTIPQIGEYALQVTEGGRLEDKQLDNARTSIRRCIKQDKGAKVYLTTFPDRPVTSKGSEARMGKGKGAVEFYAKWVSAGAIVFELTGCRKETARDALIRAARVLPLKTKVITAPKEGESRTPPRVLPFFLKQRFKLAEALKYDKKLELNKTEEKKL
ncbi:hypothetical protein HK099_006223 [Clydaea vesicula]|uniref:Ribosomal protein L16 n=1 Tax=Clydaea vesicula TaxID=447962 RepID=A0AAD5U1F5_9FUNG|nr:hypothetical protein HK099_006223 [Clydaea vesicula]KAJ3396107.1 hypothetical protein HDU92_003976 [Lobulomyces angularis]